MPEPGRYDPRSFEERWVSEWADEELYRASDESPRPKLFVMEMFPYPSGDLHLGHVENYAIADVLARFHRMRGSEVMHPMGYDAFGLPAENAAIQRGVHPKEWTLRNVTQMRSSLRRLGLSYDWSREVVSCEPGYYRWNQWIFLRLLERGLAYRKESSVNWCPVDKTVLAKEQLSTGVCWRCGSVPVVRSLTQWYLKITDYSDRLLDDMDLLDWPESVLKRQRHWIGRSHGAEIVFPVEAERGGTRTELPIFTTRPDTLWGATFVALAPEHPLAAELARGTEVEPELDELREDVRARPELERVTGANRARRAVRLPAFALHPATGERLPVFAVDYVLPEYASGAIMGVPAHDQRDLEFAREQGLPVRVVVRPEDGELGDDLTEAYEGPGVLCDSGELSGTRVDPAEAGGLEPVLAWLEQRGLGRPATTYRQRDWLVSRQRYWGTPIPVVYCDGCGLVPVPDDELPVLLPETADYSPSDEVAPLAKVEGWVSVDCPRCGGPARRDTDTLDTFFDSSWYFLRYCDPRDEREPFSRELAARWAPVDWYFGGIDHAVMHLIYARFFTKFFQDLGLVDFPEPFVRLFNQGWVTLAGRDMSKSTGHLIEAAETIDRWGADAARVYILFSSPPAADFDLPSDALEDVGRVAHSWLARVWRLLSAPADEPLEPALERDVHRAVKEVTEDVERLGYNTAIARLMTLLNTFSRLERPAPREAAETFLRLLAPFAPFLAEELWHRYGHETSIHREAWPAYDEELATPERVTLVVQVNGKVRDRLPISSSLSEDEMREAALASERVKRLLDGQAPRRVIVVALRRLVSVTV